MDNCHICKNKGLIEMTHKISKNTYAFKCECYLGEKYKGYPQWLGALAQYYEPLITEGDAKPEGILFIGKVFGAKKNNDEPDQSLERSNSLESCSKQVDIKEDEVDFSVF